MNVPDVLRGRCQAPASSMSSAPPCGDDGKWHALHLASKSTIVICRKHTHLVWRIRDQFAIHGIRESCDSPGTTFDTEKNRCYRDDVTMERFMETLGKEAE